MEDAVTTQVTSNEWSRRHAIDQTTACQNKHKLSMSWFRLCLHESLCKTVKWHRVPVLFRRWWISVHHVEQAVIIQFTLKWSHSGIACSREHLLLASPRRAGGTPGWCGEFANRAFQSSCISSTLGEFFLAKSPVIWQSQAPNWLQNFVLVL